MNIEKEEFKQILFNNSKKYLIKSIQNDLDILMLNKNYPIDPYLRVKSQNMEIDDIIKKLELLKIRIIKKEDK